MAKYVSLKGESWSQKKPPLPPPFTNRASSALLCPPREKAVQRRQRAPGEGVRAHGTHTVRVGAFLCSSDKTPPTPGGLVILLRVPEPRAVIVPQTHPHVTSWVTGFQQRCWLHVQKDVRGGSLSAPTSALFPHFPPAELRPLHRNCWN